MTTIALLTEDDVRASSAADEEAGFGALATPRGRLPLTGLDVHARIDGLLVEVSVSQTFVNATDEPLEGTYIFPLPDRAAVTRFQMQVTARLVEGVLQERGAARRDYDQAIAQGHRAAITEEERPGVFTMRVGNIMPGERATVRLTLTGPLAYRDGEATFRFPLVVAPRYIPGIPLSGRSVGDGTASDTDAVPDASRISPPVLLPGFPNPVCLSLTVDVHPSELGTHDFRSALHCVLQVVSDGGVRRILLQPGERLDRDFILRFRVGDAAVRTALTLTPDTVGAAEGTFALTLVPPTEMAPSPGRDVIFVLDRSGSMNGWKMVAARRAVSRMVDTLTEHDHFAVYAFDDRIETPPGSAGMGLQTASDRNRFRAVEFLAGVAARGGTEMAQPLSLAAHLLAGAGTAADGGRQRARLLVLITDGQVGNEDQILHALTGELRQVRVFALGIDRAVNAAFLRRLADLGGGACELVEAEERLEEVLEHVHRHLGAPVLTGLRLEETGFTIDRDSLVPARLPDLFPGAPLHVLGRYHGAAEGSVRLSATASEGAWAQTVRGGGTAGGAVPSVWARGHTRELEDCFVGGRGSPGLLEKRIVETSLKYGVLCRFTAFLAVDRAEAPNEGGKQNRVLLPVDAPAGWEMFNPAEQTYFGFARRAVGTPPPAPVVASRPFSEPPELYALRREVEKSLTPGSDMVTMGKLPQTPRLKKVIDTAIEEADHLRHAEVDAEHLLLGLLGVEKGVAAQLLARLGLTLEEIREQIRTEFAQQDKAAAGWPNLPGKYERFTERARTVLQFASQEAQRFNHEYIGTEHLLLALINEGSGLVATILRKLTRNTAADAAGAGERETTSKSPSTTGA